MQLKKFRFVMIELVMITLILLVLTELLLPALSKSRKRADEVDCMSKCRQIGVGITLYSDDNRMYYPVEQGIGDPRFYWTQKFKPYIADNKPVTEPVSFLECPSMPLEYRIDDNAKSNYLFNYNINRRSEFKPESIKNDQIVSPSKTMLIMCGSTATDPVAPPPIQALKSRCGGPGQIIDLTLRFPHPELYKGANVGFVDSHVEPLKYSDAGASPGVPFWDPSL